MKDLGIGFGVFKKMEPTTLDNELVAGQVELKDNMLINIGEAYVVVNLLPEPKDDNSLCDQLRLKIFGGNNNGDVYEYNLNNMMQGGEILLGRTPECDIKINDKLMSKIQCSVRVHVLGTNSWKWMLHDGYKAKPSTNGTWLYINDDLKIFNGMTFKANQTIFTARF
jgi:hypothetical protein